jgi:hypothetical protein
MGVKKKMCFKDTLKYFLQVFGIHPNAWESSVQDQSTFWCVFLCRGEPGVHKSSSRTVKPSMKGLSNKYISWYPHSLSKEFMSPIESHQLLNIHRFTHRFGWTDCLQHPRWMNIVLFFYYLVHYTNKVTRPDKYCPLITMLNRKWLWQDYTILIFLQSYS